VKALDYLPKAASSWTSRRRGSSSWRVWLRGARLRTLPASVVPVAVGAAVAYDRDPGGWRSTSWVAVGLALMVAVALQVGVNYANDYSDGVKGTDQERVGPVRLVASGLKPPSAVKRAALFAFGVAGLCGVGLSAWKAPWLIAVGALCIAAGWFYTGGAHPYGYVGLGEVAVFTFFGVVATVGTAYVVGGRIYAMALVESVGVGALAVALMLANNLRDFEGDRSSGKRTLVVRLGDNRARVLYEACLIVPFGVVGLTVASFTDWWPALALAAFPFILGPLRRVASGDSGRALLPVLSLTSRAQVVYGALLATGLALAR
jgi:1,4-dihydroxy-2-naphthoate octaprenyltransferase